MAFDPDAPTVPFRSPAVLMQRGSGGIIDTIIQTSNDQQNRKVPRRVFESGPARVVASALFAQSPEPHLFVRELVLDLAED